MGRRRGEWHGPSRHRKGEFANALLVGHRVPPVLAEKREIIALNKLDLLPEEARESAVKDLRAELRLGADTVVMGISGATGMGVRELMEECWKLAGESRMMSRPAFVNAPKE